MEEPHCINIFDLHNHPFNKGAVSKDQLQDFSWGDIKVDTSYSGSLDCLPIFPGRLREIHQHLYNSDRLGEKAGIMDMAAEIFNSQSSLSGLKHAGALFVTGLIAMEEGYAQTWFIRCVLPWISPLDAKLITAIRKRKVSYYSRFNAELDQIWKTKNYKSFEILKSINDFKKGELNTILSIEGAHNLQDSFKNPNSILTNLSALKKDLTYRFLYLTLTHLTMQPAAVHCFGTYIRKVINLTPNRRYQPDPKADGISELGKNVIRIAYESKPYTLLIDIKHMSLRSRQAFYQMRREEHFEHIPILATHMGVTGCRFRKAIVEEIKRAPTWSFVKKCDRVKWVPVYNKKTKTRFNPWTINLYDEDIIEVLKSNGIIGLNMDQRILGVGEFPHECMSPLEVRNLRLECLANGEDTSDQGCEDGDAEGWDPTYPISMDPFFQLTKKEKESERRYLQCANPRHIDYLACNIIHIVKVGHRKGFNGEKEGKMDVCESICIGSDFDGLTDPINLPTKRYAGNNQPGNFVTAYKFAELKLELEYSLTKCLALEKKKSIKAINPQRLVEMVFVENGWSFLQKNFR